jgi:hypothetical protein
MEDDEGVQDEREIWEVTHVSEQDLETTEGEGVDLLVEYVRRIDSSSLVFSLSSHRHSYRSYLYLSLYRFIINNKLNSWNWWDGHKLTTTRRRRTCIDYCLDDCLINCVQHGREF